MFYSVLVATCFQTNIHNFAIPHECIINNCILHRLDNVKKLGVTFDTKLT